MFKCSLDFAILHFIPLAMPLAAVAQNGHEAHHVATVAATPEAALSNGVVQ